MLLHFCREQPGRYFSRVEWMFQARSLCIEEPRLQGPNSFRMRMCPLPVWKLLTKTDYLMFDGVIPLTTGRNEASVIMDRGFLQFT